LKIYFYKCNNHVGGNSWSAVTNH